MSKSTFIIAEAGVNHNGESSTAFDLIDVAKECGADAIKFQLFLADKLVTQYASKANYQLVDADSNLQLEMLKKLELTKETFKKIKEYCKAKSIEFMCTAFDKDNLNFLVEKLDTNILKIASGELTNAPLLIFHAQKKFDMIVSTGMSNFKEVEEALGVIAFGYLNKGSEGKIPSISNFKDAFNSKLGQDILKEKVTLLHCTTEYPAPIKDLNLKAIQSMRDYFGLKVGYSDHSKGIDASVAAVCLGANVIEKHFTLDKSQIGPDHKASLDPTELKNLILKIRALDLMSSDERLKFMLSIVDIDKMSGNGIKKAMNSEINNISIARRYLVANENISIGDTFTEKNLTCKRSKNGISPIFYWDFLNTISKKEYSKDDII